ncbi:MAG: heme lyase CcmF/NrfE family subunit [Alphaproteobacteria bacterium]
MISNLGNFFLFFSLLSIIIFYTGWSKKIFTSDKVFLNLIYVTSASPFLLLVIGFAISDYTVLNIFQNSYIDDPIFYKVTSAWGSHEGSILLWIFLINMYGIFFLKTNNNKEIHKQIIFISSLFILYLLISSNPFQKIELDTTLEGLGLNPILQHLLFIIHPPTLFLGYIGLIIPFVLASHILISKNFSKDLFNQMLLWSKLSWFFLTFGIVLGSYWAYSELGWGGWWFWDPVENISLIPWLLNTALIHSLQVSIKSNQLKLWSLNLALYSFIAAVFGTFLVRSNLIVSVHSFASDPLRGLFLIMIIAYLFIVTLRLNIKSVNYFNQDTFKIMSKETFLLLNNIFFIAAALTVLVGTIYPLFSEIIYNSSVSIGAPYYNFAFNLLMAPIILLMAFAPQIKWGEHKKKNNQTFYIIAISIVITAIVYYLLGNIFFALSVFITMPLFIKSFLVFFKKVSKDRSFFAQWLAHLSIGLFIVAAVYTEQFDYEKNITFEKGDSNEIVLNKGASLLLENIKDSDLSNHQKISVDLIVVEKNLKYYLSPSKNIYQPSGQVTNEVSTVNRYFDQYYATISMIESDKVSINIVFKPFINLLWISSILLVFSIFLSIIKRR